MKILLAGASGMIGSALAFHLRAAGHNVVTLVRPPQIANPHQAGWNPATGELEGPVAGAEAAVNLAGASVGEGRWTPNRKLLLRSSRVDTTRSLVNSLKRLEPPPKIFVSASAIGYYGDRSDESLTEDSCPGDGFLAQLAQDWEGEAQRAEEAGLRTVIFRFGVILSARGGALAQMLKPFRMGLGGRLGSGRQWMSWLTLADGVRILQEAINDQSWTGVYNAVAPEPVTNAEFTRKLGRVLHRPALFPVPTIALKALFGEMAETMLLASQRVEPKKLAAASYSYLYPELVPALQSALSNR